MNRGTGPERVSLLYFDVSELASKEHLDTVSLELRISPDSFILRWLHFCSSRCHNTGRKSVPLDTLANSTFLDEGYVLDGVLRFTHNVTKTVQRCEWALSPARI